MTRRRASRPGSWALDAAQVRRCLRAHERVQVPALPGRRNHLRAAVLVPLILGEDPACVVTERARSMRLHPGEIAFPGGRPEPGDADLFATAAREAEEEVAIQRPRALGELSSVPLYTSDYRLFPFVAAIDEAGIRASSSEVERVLRIGLRDCFELPFLHGIEWSHEGAVLLSPVFELGDRLMFGGTAHVFYELLQAIAPALGRPVPALRPGRYAWSDVL